MIGYSQAFEGLYGPKPIEGKNKMNNRIKELADQAELTIRTGRGNTYMSHPEFNKKFAELIVRECIGCCEQVISDPVPESVDTWLNGGEQCIQEIQAHFGVEE